MQFKVAQAVGLNSDQKAAQVSSQIRDEDNLFLAVLQLVGDDAFTKGRQILSELSDLYFEAEGTTPAQKLNQVFSEAQNKLSKEESFDLIFAAVSGKILYLIGHGDIEAYLKRSDKITPLLDLGQPNQLISGFLQDGDRVCLATKSLIRFLGEDLKSSLELSLQEWEEEVSAKVGGSSQEDQGLAGLILDVVSSDVPIPTLNQSSENAIEPSYAPASSKISNMVSSVLSLASKFVPRFGKRSESNDIALYNRQGFSIGRFFPKSGRGRLILAILLIIIIGLGAGLKYKSDQDKSKIVQYNTLLQQARDDLNAASGLKTLNPTEAKSKLDSAKEKVSQAIAIRSTEEAAKLKEEIDQNSDSILQQFSVAEFPIFLDLDLVKKDFKADYLSLSLGKLLLLDPQSKTLILVDLEKKSNQILAGKEQLGEASLASINGNLAFVYSQDKGILRIDIGSQKVTSVSKKDDDWGEIADLSGFAGNVYLIDKGKKGTTDAGQIWKYLPTSAGYSDNREYLTKDTKVDFVSVKRMQIESSIYILKGEGEILRFTRGASDHFSLGGLDKPIKNPKSIFVSSETENLYILDSENSRIVIVNKTGVYQGQYQGDRFASASDLVVDEEGKKVYILEGSKIYQMDLK